MYRSYLCIFMHRICGSYNLFTYRLCHAIHIYKIPIMLQEPVIIYAWRPHVWSVIPHPTNYCILMVVFCPRFWYYDITYCCIHRDKEDLLFIMNYADNLTLPCFATLQVMDEGAGFTTGCIRRHVN